MAGPDDPNERRYEGYRKAAREAAMDDMYERARSGEADRLILTKGLLLTAIDDAAMDAWRGGTFPWRRIIGQTRPYIRRFETAIWLGDTLLGLCIGRVSHGNDNVTIHFIERQRGVPYLKGYVAEIATETADNYGAILRKGRLKLKNPTEGAIPLYRELGFEVAESYRGCTYYDRSIDL